VDVHHERRASYFLDLLGPGVVVRDGHLRRRDETRGNEGGVSAERRAKSEETRFRRREEKNREIRPRRTRRRVRRGGRRAAFGPGSERGRREACASETHLEGHGVLAKRGPRSARVAVMKSSKSGRSVSHKLKRFNDVENHDFINVSDAG
jgi:hypothetical protein